MLGLLGMHKDNVEDAEPGEEQSSSIAVAKSIESVPLDSIRSSVRPSIRFSIGRPIWRAERLK